MVELLLGEFLEGASLVDEKGTLPLHLALAREAPLEVPPMLWGYCFSLEAQDSSSSRGVQPETQDWTQFWCLRRDVGVLGCLGYFLDC